MSLSDQDRIIRHRLAPRIVELWRALAPLQSVVSFMNTGAHPDDEMSAMLAALGLRDGLDLSYACSTRGEGGQNDIGTESGTALGVLRTAEMEQACDVLDLQLYWLSQHLDDSITDFGFSKSGIETLSHWGRDRTLRRFVEILRTERPDIICPTFLDVPGQHGHHRAMTEAAYQAMELAADPAYETEQTPWQVKKLYLPAWSGAGQAYDDDLPPPPETLRIDGAGTDPVTGFSYAQIGQQSRVFHRTQGMGRWVAPGAGHDWPLHLAVSTVAGPDTRLASGIEATLVDLELAVAQAHFDAARAGFPNYALVLEEVSAGLGLLQSAKVAPEHAHKIMRKCEQAARVIRLAAGIQLDATLDRVVLHNGETTDISLALDRGALEVDTAEIELEVLLPDGWSTDGSRLAVESASPDDPLPSQYRAAAPRLPCVSVSVKCHGVSSQTRLPFVQPPVVVPDCRAAVDPSIDIVNVGAGKRTLSVQARDVFPESARPELCLPDGWVVTRDDTRFSVDIGSALPGHYHLPLLLDGRAAETTQLIGQSHEHVQLRALSRPAVMDVHVIDCALPDAKVAYIGGGNDQVDHWLTRAGFDITPVEVDALTSPEALARYDTLVVGIFAMRFCEGLVEAMPRVHQWVEAGGNLLTLYHRPWDNWDPEVIPPRYLEIGKPSLRWRVTDQNAAVTHLKEHPVLSHPNLIGTSDWEGWHKERGLYFAKEWDALYSPLIEMADADEAALKGALLSADIGRGRHSHCALILHQQLALGVAGAYRLMANLLAPRN